MRGLAAVKAALSVLIALTPASGWLIKGTPCQGTRSGVPLSFHKGGSDVGTEHLLLTDEEDTGAPPLRPGLEPSLLVSPLPHTHTTAHT